MVTGNLDILVITETKLDESFPSAQFILERYQVPLRLDRNSEGGGIMVYVREGIPCRKLKSHNTIGDFEGIFFEIDLRKNKWNFFGGYNPKKENIVNFLTNVGSTLGHFITNYDNQFIMGDFNSESTEKELVDFCETYNLCDIVKKPTCYKNPINPRSIDLFLTNMSKNYHHSNTVETGISVHHKMMFTVMKSFFKKAAPHIIKYRDYKRFDVQLFRNELGENLTEISESEIDYDLFENIFLEQINKYAPLKEKQVRANNAPFMNKILSKAVMKLSRLRNTNAIVKYRHHPSIIKIKESITNKEMFSFSKANLGEIKKQIHSLNMSKPTTLKNIPAKIVALTKDACSPLITKINNKSIENCNFPKALKVADVTPAHKKEETTNKGNYRPVSILPSISTRHHASKRVYTRLHVSPRVSTRLHASPRVSTRLQASPCVSTYRHASPRISTRLHASPRVSTRLHASPRVSTRLHASPRVSTRLHVSCLHASPRVSTRLHACMPACLHACMPACLAAWPLPCPATSPPARPPARLPGRLHAYIHNISTVSTIS